MKLSRGILKERDAPRTIMPGSNKQNDMAGFLHGLSFVEQATYPGGVSVSYPLLRDVYEREKRSPTN